MLNRSQLQKVSCYKESSHFRVNTIGNLSSKLGVLGVSVVAVINLNNASREVKAKLTLSAYNVISYTHITKGKMTSAATAAV